MEAIHVLQKGDQARRICVLEGMSIGLCVCMRLRVCERVCVLEDMRVGAA